MTRKNASSAIYTGTDVPGATGTGEVLTTGAVVRVISTSSALGEAISLVDLPSTAFGTGRTYSVWAVPASSLMGDHDPSGRECALAGRGDPSGCKICRAEMAVPAVPTKRGAAFACGSCYVSARPGEYEPDGGPWGACAVCGDQTQVHRISWAEADFLRSSLAEVPPA